MRPVNADTPAGSSAGTGRPGGAVAAGAGSRSARAARHRPVSRSCSAAGKNARNRTQRSHGGTYRLRNQSETVASAIPVRRASAVHGGGPGGHSRSIASHSASVPVSVESKLWTCRGEVYARHHIFVDSRYLPLGFTLVVRVSTRRSDGVWVGKDYTVTTAKRYQMFTTYQYRGVGGGLRVTDVHVRHFPALGQASYFQASTAKSVYGPWNGPEAGPRE